MFFNFFPSIKFFLEYHRIFQFPVAKIITMGDSLIDIPLLIAGDLGVAVGNARQEVKDVADLITVTNDDNAVEYIIRNYMLGEEK